MTIRRRPKNITNVLSSMDSRIRSTELRQTKVASYAATESFYVAGSTSTPSVVVSTSAPSTFKKIVSATYKSKLVTGGIDEVVLTFDTNNGLSKDKSIKVSGLNSPYAVSGVFVVTERVSADPLYTVTYSPNLDVPSTSVEDLLSRFLVDTTESSTTTATINFTGPHTFEVGDIISTIELGGLYPGLDGIYLVSGTPTSSSITYEFDQEIASPIALETVLATQYVYSVAQEVINVGDTWIDTSTNPDTTYYWDGIRWAVFNPASAITSDAIAPSPVVNVSDTADNYADEAGQPKASMLLLWEAPTTNANDSPLTDLAGYDVWLRYSPSGDWNIKTGIVSTDTSFFLDNLRPGVTVYLQVVAVDTSLNRSVPTTYTTSTGVYSSTLLPPSAPILSADLGVVTVTWNGIDNSGSPPNPSLAFIEVHVSPINGFSTSSSTRIGSMIAKTDNYIPVSRYPDGAGGYVDMDYETDYYFKLVAVDNAGNRTAGSAQPNPIRISRVGTDDIVAGSITASKIGVGELTAYLVSANTIATGSGTTYPRIEMSKDLFVAYGASSSDVKFSIDANTGQVTIASGLTIGSGPTGTVDSTLLTQINGNKVATGTLSADTINGGTLNANLITVTNLSATSITSGTFSADRISGGTIDASSINGVTINGTTITGGTIFGTAITGSTLATAPPPNSGLQHVEIEGSVAAFYDTLGDLTGTIIGSGTARGASLLLAGPGSGRFYIWSGGAVIEGANGTYAALSDNGFAVGGNKLYTIEADLDVDGDANIVGNINLNGANSNINLNGAIITKNANGQIEAPGFRSTGDLNVAGSFSYAAPTGSGTQMSIQSNNLVVKQSSSKKYKEQISDADIDLDLLTSAVIRQFKYTGDVGRDGDLKAPLLYGYIAEELHDLGLGKFVLYDENGEPDAVQFNSIIAGLHRIIQRQEGQLKSFEQRLSDLEGGV
jgi:hypothetical protein